MSFLLTPLPHGAITRIQWVIDRTYLSPHWYLRKHHMRLTTMTQIIALVFEISKAWELTYHSCFWIKLRPPSSYTLFLSLSPTTYRPRRNNATLTWAASWQVLLITPHVITSNTQTINLTSIPPEPPMWAQRPLHCLLATLPAFSDSVSPLTRGVPLPPSTCASVSLVLTGLHAKVSQFFLLITQDQ